MPKFSKSSLPFKVSDKNSASVSEFTRPCYTTGIAHIPVLDHPTGSINYGSPFVTQWPESGSELYRPSDRALVSEVSANFCTTDPYGCILDFLDRSRYFFFSIAPQLHSRG
jgi:hypothetical protein